MRDYSLWLWSFYGLHAKLENWIFIAAALRERVGHIVAATNKKEEKRA